MKRYLKLVFVLVFTLSLLFSLDASVGATELKTGIGIVEARGGLRLRAKPSTSAEIITTAHYGDNVVIIRKSDDWYLVNYNLHIGYMHGDYLTVKTRENAELGTGAVDASLVKDPTVIVSLSNLHYSMIGEVAKPGQYAFEEEKVTILDAISKAGDLTIQGRRNDVMVLRQENGHQKIYKIDLCSGKDIFSSPAYYLQQNDVVYVTPNDTKKRSSTLNGNTVQSTGFWLSISSLLVTVLTFLKVN